LGENEGELIEISHRAVVPRFFCGIPRIPIEFYANFKGIQIIIPKSCRNPNNYFPLG
jgi:hypothetical protein